MRLVCDAFTAAAAATATAYGTWLRGGYSPLCATPAYHPFVRDKRVDAYITKNTLSKYTAVLFVDANVKIGTVL